MDYYKAQQILAQARMKTVRVGSVAHQLIQALEWAFLEIDRLDLYTIGHSNLQASE
jgi:hypothetical protein